MAATVVTGQVAEISAWRDRRFVVFAIGNTLNNIGEGMYGIALPLLLLQRTGSLRAMSVLASIAPLILTVAGPVFGALADRYGSRVLVLPGLVLQFLAALPLVVYLSVGTPPTWVLFASEVLVQTGGVAYRGGWMASVPNMFPDRPGRARGALFTCYQATVVIGPALAAGLVGAVGYTGVLWINLATFLAPMLVWAAGIKPRPTPVKGGRLLRGIAADLREGWQMFRASGNPFVVMIVLIPCNFVFSVGTLTLAIFYLKHTLGMSAQAVGVAIACVNIGALGGAIFVSEGPRWPIRPVAVTALIGSAVCLCVVPATTVAAVAVVALVVLMVLDSLISVAAEMLMYSTVPAESIGRSIGFWRLVLGFPQFLAPAVVAVVSDSLGARGAFVMLAVVALLPGLWLTTRRDLLTS